MAGIEKIVQTDKFIGADSLYKETNRPQFHFSTKRGWINDPNGLVYHNGEYHLYYQHNPYEINWENMHWGHAVSTDLLYWTELGDVMFPDELGTMFSGSAVIDKSNTAGWGENTMVAAYTTVGERQVQCLAYSHANGRSFTKYDKNPIIDSKDKWNNADTRDPKVFWYELNNEWVMALYEVNGISIYTSKNLKDWQYESHVIGFFECPELFELPIDGNAENTKWVMYGASGTYMIGDFDGKTFSPTGGKYRTFYGSQYAAQTYNNTPDGRRIQVGWGRIEHPGMPFTQMMMIPTELSLRTTREGVRLYANPINEIENLADQKQVWENLTLEQANAQLKTVKSDLLHVKMNVEILNGFWYSVFYNGNEIIKYDGNFDTINDAQMVQDELGSFKFDLEFLIDRTSLEVFCENGKLVLIEQLEPAVNDDGLFIKAGGDQLTVHKLEISSLKSIWP